MSTNEAGSGSFARNDVVVEHAIGEISRLQDLHFVKRGRISDAKKERVVGRPARANLHWHIGKGIGDGILSRNVVGLLFAPSPP